MTKDGCDRPQRFDLEERTAQFGERVIHFLRTLHRDPITVPLISQLVRAAGSVGANYGEANEAGSRKEFKYRISVARREAKESKHWLRMIAAASPAHATEARELWREAHELTAILASIYRRSK